MMVQGMFLGNTQAEQIFLSTFYCFLSVRFMVLCLLFDENVYLTFFKNGVLCSLFILSRPFIFEKKTKMRILNFLIIEVLMVFGSTDFKVALIQTPPRE